MLRIVAGPGKSSGLPDKLSASPVIGGMTSNFQDRLGRQLTGDHLLTPQEVAAMFRVDPKTVTRWAKLGKLNAVRTLGGHRRYKESEVRALLNPDVAAA